MQKRLNEISLILNELTKRLETYTEKGKSKQIPRIKTEIERLFFICFKENEDNNDEVIHYFFEKKTPELIEVVIVKDMELLVFVMKNINFYIFNKELILINESILNLINKVFILINKYLIDNKSLLLLTLNHDLYSFILDSITFLSSFLSKYKLIGNLEYLVKSYYPFILDNILQSSIFLSQFDFRILETESKINLRNVVLFCLSIVDEVYNVLSSSSSLPKSIYYDMIISNLSLNISYSLNEYYKTILNFNINQYLKDCKAYNQEYYKRLNDLSAKEEKVFQLVFENLKEFFIFIHHITVNLNQFTCIVSLFSILNKEFIVKSIVETLIEFKYLLISNGNEQGSNHNTSSQKYNSTTISLSNTTNTPSVQTNQVEYLKIKNCLKIINTLKSNLTNNYIKNSLNHIFYSNQHSLIPIFNSVLSLKSRGYLNVSELKNVLSSSNSKGKKTSSDEEDVVLNIKVEVYKVINDYNERNYSMFDGSISNSNSNNHDDNTNKPFALLDLFNDICNFILHSQINKYFEVISNSKCLINLRNEYENDFNKLYNEKSLSSNMLFDLSGISTLINKFIVKESYNLLSSSFSQINPMVKDQIKSVVSKKSQVNERRKVKVDEENLIIQIQSEEGSNILKTNMFSDLLTTENEDNPNKTNKKSHSSSTFSIILTQYKNYFYNNIIENLYIKSWLVNNIFKNHHENQEEEFMKSTIYKLTSLYETIKSITTSYKKIIKDLDLSELEVEETIKYIIENISKTNVLNSFSFGKFSFLKHASSKNLLMNVVLFQFTCFELMSKIEIWRKYVEITEFYFKFKI